jgi:hypothetical protein
MLSLNPRRWAAAFAVLGTAGFLSGCVSIKSQTAVQRAPGVVELRGVVCASDYNASRSPACRVANIAERDNGTGDAEATGLGQLLVGFRVPEGTTAPESFPSDAQDVSFTANAGYTAALESLFPTGDGERWAGYISSAKSFDPGVPADRVTGFRPEFGLPARPGGFEGPFPWRLVVGFRQLANVGQAGNPVNCNQSFCADAPRNDPPVFPANLQAPVSDFGFLAAPGATVQAGSTATVAFPLRYTDGGNLGAQDVALGASTNVPAAAATLAADSLPMQPGTSTVEVSVPVPPGTPPGAYVVTLRAAAGSPQVERTSTAVLTVAPPPLPAPPGDRDGDAVVDPSDRCPDTPRGAFDADNDGCVGPYRRISATPSGGWDVSDSGLTIGTMRIKGLPRGARVELRCSVCRVRQTLTAKRSEINLKRLRAKKLRRGTGFTVKVTRAGFIGQQLKLTLRNFGHTRREFQRIARRPFETRKRCIPVGGTRTAKRCTATPPTGP